jgi:4-hydroxybenzoate polyprenyltransferase
MKTMADKITTAAAYSTSGATFLAGSMSLNEWLAVGGFILAVATFAVNIYFQRKRDRREERLSERRWGVRDESDYSDPQL